MNLYFDNQYPAKLVKTIEFLYTIKGSENYIVVHQGNRNLEEFDKDRTIVFLFDTAKKGISPVTRRHYDEGYRVFAFMLRTAENFSIFGFSLHILSLWKKILELTIMTNTPFIGKITYKSSKILIE